MKPRAPRPTPRSTPPFDLKAELARIFAMAPKPRAEYTLHSVASAVIAAPRVLPELTAFGRAYAENMAERLAGTRSLSDAQNDPDARLRADVYRKWHAQIAEVLIYEGVQLLEELADTTGGEALFEALASRLDAALQALEALALPWWMTYAQVDERPISVVAYARTALSRLETAQIRAATESGRL